MHIKGHMATSMELAELEHGDGAWENIQEVLRFGFRSLWRTFAGVDSRLQELEKSFTSQQTGAQHQQQHLEAIAQTLNAMSEQLRVEQEEAVSQQVEARLQHLEGQLYAQLAKDRSTPVDDNTVDKACITKVERRLGLLEEEMGHVVAAIDQKAYTEAVLDQGRTLQEAIRNRCKKEAFDHEVVALQERIQQQGRDLEEQLSISISDLKATQETSLQSELESWAAKTQEIACQSIHMMIDRDTQQQREILGAMDIQIKLCCEALEAQQKRMDEFQVEIEKQVRLTIAGDREDIARQCSEAHGRIDYQFRTEEESLERIRSEQHHLREDIAAIGITASEQAAAGVTAAVDGLDRRVLDREQHELAKLHQQVTEEVQLMIANALKALEPAKDREQRRLKQHQQVVGRKLAELDQMMQLIGRQLIQNTSQLQVVRNEQLVHNFHLEVQDEDAGYDEELLLQYDRIADSSPLAEISQNSVLTQDTHPTEMTSEVHEHTELLARRSQHQELQEQLNKKLRDYSEVLDSSQQQ